MTNNPARESRSQPPARAVHGRRPAGVLAAAVPVMTASARWPAAARFTGAAGRGACKRIGGPVAVGYLPGRRGERLQRGGDRGLPRGRELAQDAGDQCPAPGGRLIHHLPPGGGDRDLHGTAVRAGAVAADQALAQQPVTHPPGRRRRDVQRPGQVYHPLRAPGGEHHQRPVLGDRGVLRRRAQRSGRHRHQGAARRQHRIHRRLIRCLLSHDHAPRLLLAHCNKFIVNLSSTANYRRPRQRAWSAMLGSWPAPPPARVRPAPSPWHNSGTAIPGREVTELAWHQAWQPGLDHVAPGVPSPCRQRAESSPGLL